ncbi:conserved exported hypothetical protein [Rhodococcus sp. RD6.2]|jgi:hypothetical protein|uniref:hypothetical protein n=1 Tax=Rhodococcus sp. RD6.2 TaxID=260936 RepID=UPI00063B6BDE|nr:hypothetical protein [Rhodococcus sp. RD6.2]CRK51589.1 conserved exported hypothetical protein [Rhodococcus sp. RD6.2]
MKRTAAVVGALGLTLGLGAGAATANAQVVPAPAAAEATPEVLPGQVGTGSMVIDTIERAANEEDAAGAIMTATGEMTAEGLRECGLGMLIGTTTEEFTPRNVGTFLTVAGKRLVAIAQGPAAVVSVVAGGCVERALLNAYDVPAGSAKISGSVASLALGGLLGTGLLATASSDTGLLDAASSGTGSDTASADTASADTASSDTGSAGLFDSGSLEASAPISDSLLAGSAGA